MANAKIFIVLIKDGRFVSTKSKNFENIDIYKERMRIQHDMLLGSHLERSVYTKLYSYTHLINGLAIHLTSDEALDIQQNAEGVRAIYEDVKMEKLTTHTPDLLGLPSGFWTKLGGPTASGVVIGMIDTGINPFHPSFLAEASNGVGRGIVVKSGKFKGKCVTGDRFPGTACNKKIVGAQYFARSATAAGEFNASRDYASTFDADGHGRQVT
ncbi:unnamed protein product [Withania somnifera]